MRRHTFSIGAVIAIFALSQAPVFGQAGSRPNTTGSSSGSAAPRGGDPGGASSSSSAGSASSGSGSASGAVSRPSGGESHSGVSSRERAPERPYAVPRSGSSATGGSMASRPEGSSRPRGAEAAAAAHAVPAYSRPNPGRNSVGSAVDRRDAPAPPPGSPIIYSPYYPYYYDDWRYGSLYRSGYGYGYGFGFSHFGWYDPFMYSVSHYGSPSYSAGGYSAQKQYGTGNLRLRVEPKHAEVYVDGYFVGTVDEFDGLFQRLNIDAGPHTIELRADGYEPVEFEVLVTPGETVTYRGGMKPRMP